MNKSWKRMIGVFCFCGVMGSMPLTAYADNLEGIQMVEAKESAGANYIDVDAAAVSAVAAAVVSTAEANQSALSYGASGQASARNQFDGQAEEADGQDEEEAAAASESGSQSGAETASIQGTSDIRQQVVNYALSFLGGPYRYGGNDPRTGVDCSGFTRFVLSNAAGIQMARSSGSQASQGVAVSADQMQPGDLLFYGSKKGSINHVAMYIGAGKIVHASTYKTGIKISDWNYRNPVRIVNVLG